MTRDPEKLRAEAAAYRDGKRPCELLHGKRDRHVTFEELGMPTPPGALEDGRGFEWVVGPSFGHTPHAAGLIKDARKP